MVHLIEEATKFAEEKHEGQVRKFKGEDYVNHPKRVAEIIRRFKDSHKINELIAAALLHDTLEDTNTEINEIKNKFGELISSLVEQLTSNKEEIQEKGKQEYLADKLSNPEKISSWGLVIKLADRLDNVSDLENASPEFKEKYSEETKVILNSLENHRKLSQTQQNLIKEIKNKIKNDSPKI